MYTKISGKLFAVILLIVMLITIMPKEVMGASTTGITLDKSSVTLGEYNVETLFAKTSPDNASSQAIEWQNSNNKVVTLQRRIKDGVYYFRSALDTNKVIDIKGASKETTAKVQLWKNNNSEAQMFKITSGGIYNIEGGYTITSLCSNRPLAVKDNNPTKGSKVTQESLGDPDITTWIFEYAGDGYYFIKSRYSGLYLDVTSGKTDNGTQIQVWTENRSNSQKFKLEYISEPLETGTYYIKSALNEKKTLDIKSSSKENKAKVQLWNKNNSIAQKFEISSNYSTDINTYTIEAKCSNKVLEVAGTSNTKGTLVQQNNRTNKEKQLWYFENAGNGYYYIRSKSTGLYLDVKGGKTDNGTPIQIWTKNKTKSQQFKLELIEKNDIEEGTYKIKTALNTSKSIGVENNSTEKGAKIIIDNNSNTTSQQFEFIKSKSTRDGGNYYMIRNKNTGKVLDVVGGGLNRGTKIQQWGLNGSDAQLWERIYAGGDYYYFKSKSTGLYLDVSNGKAVNGNQLQLWTSNNTNSQKFKLEKVSNSTQYNNFEYVTLKPKNEGTAVITAKLANGKTAKCTVKVLPKNKVTNVLFIGDSQTYYNRMPEKIFAPMAEQNGFKVNVETITATDHTLQWHYENREKRGVIREETTLAKTIKSKKWDYVVLQEEVNTSCNDYNTMKTGVSNIVNYLRKNGSPDVQIVYNAVWMDISSLTPEERSFESGRTEITQEGGKIFELQKKSNANYYKLSNTSGLKGKIALSGKAFISTWKSIKDAENDIQLYRAKIKEWKNPAVKGSYLEAACLYYAIFRQSGFHTDDNLKLDKVWNYVPGEFDQEHSFDEKDQQKLIINAYFTQQNNGFSEF